MNFKRAGLAIALFSVLSWDVIPVLAENNPAGRGDESNGVESSGGHHHGKGGSEHHRRSDHPHSNKGGAQRGLNRANEVAGSHGEEGRENAAAHQHGGGSSGGDSH